MADDPFGFEELARRARARGLDLARKQFLFVRHGRTDGNRLARFQHPNDPLNADGHDDAVKAAAILRDADFAAIHASTMTRAWITAGHIAHVTRRPVIPMPELRERYFGDWIGTPGHALDWRADPPNGETLDIFIARTLDGAARALAGDAPALIVAHGGNLRVLAGAFDIALTDAMTRNGVPLVFARDGRHWTARPLTGEDADDSKR